jgi:RNA polymerase sigma-70 factor (ECF subfamily)
MEPPYIDPLIARARAGDEQALAELWRELNPLLLRYLRGRVGPAGEDVAAQTWLDAARRLPEFDGDDADFRRWLFTIARRRLIDEFRRRGRRPEEPVWPPPTELRSADAALDRTDDLASALALVRELPPDQADAVLLRVVGDLDVAQVAAVMGRSEGSVRVLVHRGLRRLATILEERRVTEQDSTAMYREQ